MIKKLLPVFAFTLSTIVFASKPIKIITGVFNFSIQVQIDSTDFSAVAVSLGSSSASGSDLVNNYSFAYDVKTAPSGMAYSRRKNQLTLTLGSYFSGIPMWGSYTVLNKVGRPVLTKTFMYK